MNGDFHVAGGIGQVEEGSRTGTPVQRFDALHPSTHTIGSVASCCGSAARSSSERLSGFFDAPLDHKAVRRITRRGDDAGRRGGTVDREALRSNVGAARRKERQPGQGPGGLADGQQGEQPARAEDGCEEAAAVERVRVVEHPWRVAGLTCERRTGRGPLGADVDDQRTHRDPRHPVVRRAGS